MLILALDTSCALGSIALLRDDAVLAETDTGGAMEHAAQIFPKLDQLLSVTNIKLTEINLYAVGIGPGSFNGIRVGIAALKGLRLATHTPMVGICSADAVAEDAAKACPNNCQQIAVLTDARRGEWYFSLYRKDATGVTPLGGNTTIAPEKLPALIHEPTYFVGPDNRALRDHFFALPWGEKTPWALFEKSDSFPRAATIGKLGAQKFLAKGSGDAEVAPIYLRAAVLPPL
jgi:tRNA threonylcarbamoyladenosine biosynthesis protein TsaB